MPPGLKNKGGEINKMYVEVYKHDKVYNLVILPLSYKSITFEVYSLYYNEILQSI